MTFERLSLLGVGLLGGSIGLRLKSTSKQCKIKGYGHNAESLSLAQEMGAIDSWTTDPAQAVQDSDLIILCTPVGTFPQLLETLTPGLAQNAVITDVGSTKRSVVRLAQQILPAGTHFIGSHPMAGSERRGIQAARADLYQDALCITTPTPHTDSIALRKVESFWQELGMRVTRLSPEDHDRLLSDISHLPHALAAALVMTQSDHALPLAGKGFLDSTRIAAGDGGLWRDIFIDNADNLRDSLHRLRLQLDRLESMLDPAQTQQLRQWLDAASQKRKSISERPSRQQ